MDGRGESQPASGGGELADATNPRDPVSPYAGAAISACLLAHLAIVSFVAMSDNRL